MKAAAKATSQVRSESVKAAGDAAENAGTKFDKLAKAAGPLGGVLSRVSPEAGAAASSIAGLASAAEGIAGAGLVASTGAAAAGLAVLAAVVGTVYVAYKIYNADAERAAMIAEEVRSATEKLTPIFDEHEAAVRRLKVATGELSAEQLANLQIGDAAAKRLQDAIGDTSKKVGQLRVEQDSMWTQAVDGIESYAPAWTPLGAAVRAFTTNSAELGTEIEALQGVVAKAIDVTKDQTETDREAVKITDKKTAATKAYSIALAERDKAAKKAADAVALYDRADQARLDDKSKELHDTTWRDARERVAAAGEAYDKLVKMYQDEADTKETLRLADLESAKRAAQEAEDREKAMFDAASASLSAISSIVSSALSSATEAARQAADTAIQHLSRIRDLRDQLSTDEVDAASLSGDALVRAYKRGEVAAADLSSAQRAAIDDVLEAQEHTAERRAKIEKRAAREAFKVEKGAALAAAAMGAALAVIQALSTLGPIAGPAAAIAISAATAAEIATIASQKPSFHRGGMVEEQGRGEVSARLLPGEAVLNRQAASALGAGGVDAMNAMNAGGGMGGSVSLRIGRLEAREVIRTDVAAGGLVVQTARAAVATGGNRAGRTGRRPIG